MSSVDKVKLADDSIYDVSVSPTGTLDALSSNKFVSQDEDDPTKIVEYDDVDKITTADTHSTIFAKATKMIKNLRYIYQKIGDISGLSESIASILTRLDKKTSKTNYGYVKIGDGINVTDGVISMQSVLDVVHPIGSIYLSLVETDPSTLFGGTWESIGQGRVLVGADGSEYIGGNTGGNKTHTLVTDEMPMHNHTVTATAKSLSHSHDFSCTSDTSNTVKDAQESTSITGSSSGNWNVTTNGSGNLVTRQYYKGGGNCFATRHTHDVSGTTDSSTISHTHTITCQTSGLASPNAINLEQPYLVVYMWKRIA